ncbi:MAG TPA: tetratricopeptide repeat protein, partial [Sulfuricurvum sp.]|nr:tetratricopeptide repeat protein [Sulfuricurvum sp.]
AIQSYQKAIKLNPKYSDAYYNLGIVYGKEDEYDKAIEVYQRAIELNPKNDKAYNNIGVIYKNKEEYDKAIEAHQKAIELNPKNDKAIINIGNIYYIKEECDKAIEVYQKVIELNPKNDAAYINLFEIQIIQDKPLSDELEKKCILFFEKNKNVFIQYEMLKILSLINQNKEVELDKWLDEYKEQNLGNWRFDELVRWANRKEGEIKEKLLEAIEIFKTKLS